MRKIIEVPDRIRNDLETLAHEKGKTLKAYIEYLCVQAIVESKIKK